MMPDPRYYSGEPDARDDAYEHDHAPSVPRAMRFRFTVEGLLKAVRDAADPTRDEWSPYRGNRIEVAVWFVRHVVREARGLGYLPVTGPAPGEIARVDVVPEDQVLARR